MGPVKRASPSACTPQSGRGGRGAKVAKVDDGFGPVYDLLPLLEGATASSIEMMKASLPHALCTAKADRHTFQSRLLDALAEMIAKTEGARNENIKDAQAGISRHQAAQETAQTRLAAAKDIEATFEVEKTQAGAAQLEAAEAHKSAMERLTEQQLAQDGMQKQKQTLVEARARFEAEVTDAWGPVREGAFSPKDWRHRRKAIGRVVVCLKEAAVTESLVAAIQVALDERPEVRSPFGLCALQHCEKALEGFMNASLAEIEKETKAIETQAQCVASAAADVAAALTRSAEQTDVSIAAENKWCDAASLTGEIGEGMRRADDVAIELAVIHEQAKGSLAELQDVVAKFVAIRDEEPQSPAATPVA